ncbi:serine/threonine protein phosphatase 2A [Chloropicon primus]|uniref:Serine/threonine-protein phosphatase 2A 55 kDa regulatory subunit B n=1 Tax=Chloropicon primus TaxID=1764295 RepID=A0A5B8MYS6_9CHLO|nr:serine/threonine protein phosphatase 2A [Chloropicon primus]UPR04718.1 serine/threonine protein phosphatase 2A [Chloropicon primus]|mmetsp:Transcript_14506/g.41329  ORF Transcript_14506/g.41329 Transcript_14506/m.41329 type:complete len:543 (+) Transcript_14506:1476-3104(+)|eukprot:QDZ25521.1 serine/threonine protein phosphatase 2A [Chloropicon primus]
MVWQCIQRFKEDGGGQRGQRGEESQEEVVSALQFSKNGEYLAAADCGGRIVLLEQLKKDFTDEDGLEQMNLDGDESPTVSGRNGRANGSPTTKEEGKADHPEGQSGPQVYYKHMMEFQSHEREFDYLKSMEIDERVNQIKFFQSASSSMNILCTNDKRIKLWSVSNRKAKNISNFNFRPNMNVRPKTTTESISASKTPKPRQKGLSVSTIVNNQILGGGKLKRPTMESIRVPCISNVQYVMNATCRRNYANGHLYHIHSIDINTDGETFISADDLHINLWNFEVMNESFNIVDMQPGNMDELTEVITSALFHPNHCNILAYSSSKGTIRLTDLRASALCDTSTKVFDVQRPQENHSFFSEIVANVTDIKFTPNGNEIIARDYLSVKQWDLRKESEPLCVYNVQDILTPKLVDLYENDCIFDKFECCMSHNGEYIASGSYSNTLRVFGTKTGSDELLEASMTPMNVHGASEPVKNRSPRFASLFGGKAVADVPKRKELDLNILNCYAKLRHMQWHPTHPLLSVARGNEIYMLSDVPGSSTPFG